jgi:hypothetical protein
MKVLSVKRVNSAVQPCGESRRGQRGNHMGDVKVRFHAFRGGGKTGSDRMEGREDHPRIPNPTPSYQDTRDCTTGELS